MVFGVGLMEYYFREWLIGLLEDDPLPFEIKHLCFIISMLPDRVELALSGDENPFRLCYPGWYYPLEAQCFFYQKYFKIRPNGRRNIYNKTKKMICDFFKAEKTKTHFRPNGRSELGNLTISLGFRGKKANFLVKI